jgi:ectoine hydroxylase-related dioxygenase (phytanoyl-CoA dioxygenase family)
MDETQKQQLDNEGYTVLKGLLSQAEIDKLVARLDGLWAEEGASAGTENYIEKNTWRLANLVNKGDIFRSMFGNETVLQAVGSVIGPNIHVSMMNARAVPPHSDPDQPLHVDTRKHGIPDALGYYVCTVAWMLDDFTLQNGATRIVPGTHKSGKLPKEVMADPNQSHPDEVVGVGKAGDALIFNGHCWHAGGSNTTDKTRRAILVHYIRGDHPQDLNQKEAVAPEVQAAMTPRERELLGLDN